MLGPALGAAARARAAPKRLSAKDRHLRGWEELGDFPIIFPFSGHPLEQQGLENPKTSTKAATNTGWGEDGVILNPITGKAHLLGGFEVLTAEGSQLKFPSKQH